MKKDIIFNRTKIIATVGPACNTKDKLMELVLAGTDCFRLNFSHADHAEHQEVIKRIREINEELGTNICVLQDLQGPKIRIGNVENGVKLVAGDKLVISTEDVMGNKEKISTTYKQLPSDVKLNETILIDDGKIELVIEKVEDHEVLTKVVHGGELKSRKGMNLPKSHLSAPSLTEKDSIDLQWGIKNDVEWVALSFVRKDEDILILRNKIEKSGKIIKIIAKIERPEAIENIDSIISIADGIMVARGDLGVEIEMEEVPMVQKMIVEKCNKQAKPVIIATQMMESMIDNPRPTRAETNDVANAVMDGADTLMLSAETAAGSYPVQAIKSMVRTILSAEKNLRIYDNFYAIDQNDPLFIHNTLVQMACQMAETSAAKGIIGVTQSGYLALRLASHRPKSNIFVFTSNKILLNTMNLIWGVRAFYYDRQVSTDETFADLEDILKKEGLLSKGDVIINTASMPLYKKQRTNALKINIVN